MPLAFEWAATLLGLAAVISAIGGIVSSLLSHRIAARHARADAEDECYERLKGARADAEKAASELYERKMREAKAK